MTTVRLQLLSFLLTSYALIRHASLRETANKTQSSAYFYRLLIISVIETIFEATMAYTTTGVARELLQLGFYMSLSTLVYGIYLYIDALVPNKRRHVNKILWYMAGAIYLLGIMSITFTMPCLYYVKGGSADYAIGVPVYITYFMVWLYIAFSGMRIIDSWTQFANHRRTMICAVFIVLCGVSVAQCFVPDVLISSIAVAFIPSLGYDLHTKKDVHTMKDAHTIKKSRKPDKKDRQEPEVRGEGPRCRSMEDELMFAVTASAVRFVKMRATDLIYMECIGNYIRICKYDNGKVVRRTVRQTMKAAAEIVSPYPSIVRVHRSFIVNMEKVKRLYTGSGTSCHSYFLEIEGVSDRVSVSRACLRDVRKLLPDL